MFCSTNVLSGVPSPSRGFGRNELSKGVHCLITVHPVLPCHKVHTEYNEKQSLPQHREIHTKLQQERINHSKRGIVVESIIGGALYRGVLYPVDKVDDVI